MPTCFLQTGTTGRMRKCVRRSAKRVGMDFLLGIIFAIILIRGDQSTVSFPNTIRVGLIYCELRQEQAAMALNESNKKLVLDGVIPSSTNFEILYLQGCDDVSSLNATLWFLKEEMVDVIIGPESTQAMEMTALLASLRNIPIIGYVSVGNTLTNKTKYSTLIRTSFGMASLGEAIGTLLKTFTWSNVALIRSNNTECQNAVTGMNGIFGNPNITLKAEIVAVTTSEIDQALDTVQAVARIILLCYGNEPNSSNGLLIQAYNKNMINPEYMYIIPYYMRVSMDSNQSDKPWQAPNISNDTQSDQLMREIYQRVLVIQATGEEPSLLVKFQGTVEQQAVDVHLSTSIKLINKEPLYLPILHDSLYAYGIALNNTIRQGHDYQDGSKLFNSARRAVRFKGVTGWLTMDNSSDRYGDYDLFAMNNQNVYDRLLTIAVSVDNTTGDLIQTVQDWRQNFFPAMPPDIPLCGFIGEFCSTSHWVTVGIGLGAGFGSLVAIFIFFWYYRKQKLEKDIFKMAWRLKINQVKFIATNTSKSNSLRSFGVGSFTTDSADTSMTMEKLPDSDFKAVASIRGIPAYAKCWQKTKSGPISLHRHHLMLLKQMKDAQHDNVNAFLGAILDDGPSVMIFWKHCAKGSLYDLVMNEDVNLDQMFSVSILNDIISGLDYLHNKCPLRYHGNLSITNCLVDSRWLVKLTDFGWVRIHDLLAEQGYLPEKVVNAHRLYHCAPELLCLLNREAPNSQSAPISMKAVDIYAFSIVMYQVLFRIEPYSDEVSESDGVLERIKQGGSNWMRPVIPKHAVSISNLITIMQGCWAEDPNKRPTVKEIKRTMYSIYGKALKRSLMDHVMSLLEKYATNLEKVVEERTHQLEIERKRADQLLYQMLPKSVAEMLKSGQSVEPETYENVTVYFSDIVGFTTLSSVSTPVQVVNMLNSLYSAFDENILLYDVYKVETIGDAYMVVSGLPHRNGLKHVFEICDMALSVINVVSNFEIAHKPGERLRIRIGIHSGPVAAAVVGLTMPRFCLFGDTVNTASRMESTGHPCKIHISNRTHELLVPSGGYVVQLRGQVELKGKGLSTTYWLLGKQTSKVAMGMYQGMYNEPNRV